MEYLISSDKEKLDVDAIHTYLCNESYWAKGRSLEAVNKSIENSICYGLYDSKKKMFGFARVVTDHVVFAYLMDFFIFDEYQNKGLGTKLFNHILAQPELKVRLTFLATASAHEFYKKFNFDALDDPERLMLKRDTNYG